jgi:hypothetical protein
LIQALAESEKCLLYQIQSIGFAFRKTKSKLIKGAVQRVDNRGYVCPSGKTTRVAVKGFFVRNHFKIAFSKVSRVPLRILTEKLELF